MRTRISLSMATAALLLCSASTPVAHAEDDTNVPVSLNVGMFGVVGSDGWDTQYAYAGPSWSISLNEKLTFMPFVGVETAPGSGNFGVLASAALEYAPNGIPVAFDLIPTLGTDTNAEGETSLWWGVGPGIDVPLPNGTYVSFTAQLGGTIGSPGLYVYPMANFCVPLP